MSSAKNILKVVVGIILAIAGIVWYSPAIPESLGGIGGGLYPFYKAFLVIFAGIFGIGILFVGLIVAWMGYEDIKTEREMKEEERKEEKKE